MKKTPKKETILSVLKQIAADIKAIRKEVSTKQQLEHLPANTKGLHQIIDDGTKKTSELVEAIKPYWSWNSMEKLDKQFPPVKTSRWFKWQQESDQELKGLSANDCAEKGIEGITLREWLIMEAMWFKENGTHLDEIGVTLCTGSRYASGVCRARTGSATVARRTWAGTVLRLVTGFAGRGLR